MATHDLRGTRGLSALRTRGLVGELRYTLKAAGRKQLEQAEKNFEHLVQAGRAILRYAKGKVCHCCVVH
jgi:hypothetical protein